MASSELHIYLIRPTKYDDDGYLLRHWRGVLPSNTLACLRGLTEKVAADKELGDVRVRIFSCDESVEAIPERRIYQSHQRSGVEVLVGLVGVQTNQAPRAVDIALRLRARGVTVLVGGFHVSGTSCGDEAPAEICTLKNAGVTLVRGEVENRWADILRDALAGNLRPIYDFLGTPPDLSAAALPSPDPRLMRKFVHSSFVTMDSSRGCPFSCSFCTIIQIQGRKMRTREPSRIAKMIAAQHHPGGIDQYFFTDDDFARNPHWREILLELIRLREEEGQPIRFLMQSDLLAHKQKDFISLARRAGCFQVFLGMESLDAGALAGAGKRQNRISEYADTVRAWQDAGIFVHAGYIVGFPHDTPDSVRQNVRRLRDEIGVDLASFFLLTPLAGSQDHTQALAARVVMDADLNRHDTFHAITDPGGMTREDAEAVYRDSWREFYSFEHRRRRLAAWPEDQRATLLQNYLWYGCATEVDQFHPMMTGFVRCKPRRDRRPGFPVESPVRHLVRRVPEIGRMVLGYGSEIATAQRLWKRAAEAKESRGWRDFLRHLLATKARESGSLNLACRER